MRYGVGVCELCLEPSITLRFDRCQGCRDQMSMAFQVSLPSLAICECAIADAESGRDRECGYDGVEHSVDCPEF